MSIMSVLRIASARQSVRLIAMVVYAGLGMASSELQVLSSVNSTLAAGRSRRKPRESGEQMFPRWS